MRSGPRRFRNTATRRWLRQFSGAANTRPRKTSRAAPAWSKLIVTRVEKDAARALVVTATSPAINRALTSVIVTGLRRLERAFMQITSCLSHTQWQAGEFTKGLKIARTDVGARKKELSRSRSSRHRFFDDLILASAQRAKPCSRGP